MSNNPGTSSRSAAIAAAVILLITGLAFFVLPNVMIWLGQTSPWLAAAAGAALVLAFFLVFWLRARYQRRGE
ncbi:membrane protein implicated in regulation of membrane protease activity [Mycoplana sp. BE70]|uniref:hypothetical protein n=1 Tax=Mycoplana sp. BE70 TaxID=2817775 RepID=UPI0028625D78|nr:hypothetical protein [Mycoplana sp. BE70]MDR6757933.1 membrane protein implicated in regulation of membrane protease activity [Mycoplana sp. BE70]